MSSHKTWVVWCLIKTYTLVIIALVKEKNKERRKTRKQDKPSKSPRSKQVEDANEKLFRNRETAATVGITKITTLTSPSYVMDPNKLNLNFAGVNLDNQVVIFSEGSDNSTGFNTDNYRVSQEKVSGGEDKTIVAMELDSESQSQPNFSQLHDPSDVFVETQIEIPLNYNEEIFPELSNCEDCVSKIVPDLTSDSVALQKVFVNLGIKTIGDLCGKSKSDVSRLPILSPKQFNLQLVLEKYLQQLKLHRSHLITKPILSSVKPQETPGPSKPAMDTPNDDKLENGKIMQPSTSHSIGATTSEDDKGALLLDDASEFLKNNADSIMDFGKLDVIEKLKDFIQGDLGDAFLNQLLSDNVVSEKIQSAIIKRWHDSDEKYVNAKLHLNSDMKYLTEASISGFHKECETKNVVCSSSLGFWNKKLLFLFSGCQNSKISQTDDGISEEDALMWINVFQDLQKKHPILFPQKVDSLQDVVKCLLAFLEMNSAPASTEEEEGINVALKGLMKLMSVEAQTKFFVSMMKF